MMRNVTTCPDCGGKGTVVKDKCPDCHGTGYIANRKRIQVSVPAGIDNGQSIRIRGKGEPGTNGGPRGDLLVEVIVSPSPVFAREDYNVFSNVPISFADAALGNEIRIKTIDGEVLYEVKPGTQSGTRVRLKGKGIPTLRDSKLRGDHYVTLTVKVPEKMTNEQKEALRAYDALMRGENPTDTTDGGTTRKREAYSSKI